MTSPSLTRLENTHSFDGYLRPDARTGTRNYLGVVMVGNCAATAARQVADYFTEKRLGAFPNVDGVVPFIHEWGCGMEKSGEPMDLLRRSLGGTIRNPNVAGAVVMALGCERNNIYAFLEQEHLLASEMLKTVVLQEVGGSRHAIDQGIAAIESMLPHANRVFRRTVPVKDLVVGLHVNLLPGDANVAKALGFAVDAVIADGGTVVLTDTVGVGSHLLAKGTERGAMSTHAKKALEQRIEWWDGYLAGRNTKRIVPTSARPSTTRPSSTLAANTAEGDATSAAPAPPASVPNDVTHAGSTPLMAVFGYGYPLPERGLLLMDTPRNEGVAATGLVAAGVTLLCLASREGSTFGAAGIPTIKIALDAAQYARFREDVDIDASPVSDGKLSPEHLGEAIYARWLACASGEPTANETLGVGDSEFLPWPIGVLA